MIGIKEYNKKITSLKNMRKITKTMQMVAASKFKKAHKAQINSQVYAEKLSALMGRLSNSGPINHPLLSTKKAVTKTLLIVFTSDRGLCGGFNNNLIRKLRSWISENHYKYTTMDMNFCGRRGYIAFRRSIKVNKYYENITIKPSYQEVVGIAKDMTESFINANYEEIFLAYNRFNGPLSQTPVIEKILPLDASVFKTDGALKRVDYIYEPRAHELFILLISQFLNFKIFDTLLANAAGEHGARMSAMDKASKNTGDLIDRYTLMRNRARQAAITTELIEIISGAEALK